MDAALVTWITENLRNPVLDPIMIFITYLGEKGIFWIAIGLLLCLPKQYRKHGILMLLSLAIGCILGEGILKNLFGRVRPVDALGLQLLIEHPGGFSFPSGHSCSSLNAAMCLHLTNRKWSIPAFAVASLIAFSRVYHGVHYLTDILAGAALGILLAYLVHKFLGKYIEQLLAKRNP